MNRIERLRHNIDIRGLEPAEAKALVGEAAKANPPVVATAYPDPDADDGTYIVYRTRTRTWAR